MSKRSEENLRGFPTKPYDMIREGLFVLGGVAVLIVLLAVFWGTPDYPSVTIQQVAKKEPKAFLQLTTSYLSGKSALQTYGPPYTNNPQNAQAILGFISPQRWLGVVSPLNAQKAFALRPLTRIAATDPKVADALATYDRAAPNERSAWLNNYSTALKTAPVAGGQVKLGAGDYGPVPVLMNGLLTFARAGILGGILNINPQQPYALENQRSLFFLQGSILNNIAGHLDQVGSDWGLSHETGPYPGAWWMWPYTFLYQIPVIGSSPNADLIAGLIMGLVFVLLVLVPIIPGLNRLPHLLGFYRVVWRDWYKQTDDHKTKHEDAKA